MKKACLIILMWGIGYIARGQYTEALYEFLANPGLKYAAIGLSVKQVSDGREILSYHADMALTPASVAKIIPTWFALQEKGENYRYKTPVYYTGDIHNGVLRGNIILQASGDPTLDSRYFPNHSALKALVDTIRKSGIRQIEGTIIVENAKDGMAIPGSWLWEDISNYYGALYLPFNYRDNTYTLHFKTGTVGTRAELLSVEPFLPGIRIENEVMVAADNKDNAWIYGGPYSSVFRVAGTLPPNRADFCVKGALHRPACTFVHELMKMLSEEEIVIHQKLLPIKRKNEWFCLYSPALKDIVYHTNKSSVNLFAEALGRLVTNETWQEKVVALFSGVGIDAAGCMLHDACGLSPMNAIPAQVLTDLLVYIGRNKHTAFLSSLSVAGIDRNVSVYSYSCPKLKNRMQAKTGSMSGIRSLTGYLIQNNGNKLAFTLLINHYTCSLSQLQNSVSQLFSALL